MGIQRNQANKQLDRSEKQTNKEYWQIGKLSLVAYLPAFALILFSGLYFKSLNKETIELSEGAKKEISTKVKENIDVYKTSGLNEEKLSEKVFNTVKSRLDTDAKVSQAATSLVAHDYIKSIVENEVKKESGNAAKDEVEKLKADWKGDLFGQITFPVIFAIASIFAAFAVKDVLVNILEKEEKSKIKIELKDEIEDHIKSEIENKTLPRLVDQKVADLQTQLSRLNTYNTYLEYRLVGITLENLFEMNESKDEDRGELMNLAIEPFLNRRSNLLCQLSESLPAQQFQHIRLMIDAESAFFKEKVKSRNSDLQEYFEIRCQRSDISKHNDSGGTPIEKSDMDSLMKDTGYARLMQLFELLEELKNKNNGEGDVNDIQKILDEIMDTNSDQGLAQRFEDYRKGKEGTANWGKR